MSAHIKLSEFLELVASWTLEKCGEEEFVVGKEEFFMRTGKVFFDDPVFENRMSYFVDWFLNERPLGPAGRSIGENSVNEFKGLTPFQVFFEISSHELMSSIEGNNIGKKTSLDIDFIQSYVDLLKKVKPQHGVYYVRKVLAKNPADGTGGQMEAHFQNLLLEDFVTGEKYRVSSSFFGLAKGDIIQGFLYPSPSLSEDHQRPWSMSAGSVVHPRLVLSTIKSYLKKERKKAAKVQKNSESSQKMTSQIGSDMRFLNQLAKTQTRYSRMKHIKPETLYQEALSAL